MLSSTSKIISFDKILQREKIILTDGSLGRGSDWFKRTIYPIQLYSDIYQERMNPILEYLHKIKEWFQEDKVYTTEKVQEEYKRIVDKVDSKIKHLDKYKRSSSKVQSDGKRILENISTLLKDNNEIMMESFHIPSKMEEFKTLEKIVLKITEFSRAKIDFSFRYEKRYRYESEYKKTEDLHTDEQLFATALYLSLVERKKNCILSPDSDFKRMLNNTLYFLTDSSVTGSDDIRTLLILNQIRVYFCNEFGIAQLKGDTADIITRNNVRCPPHLSDPNYKIIADTVRGYLSENNFLDSIRIRY